MKQRLDYFTKHLGINFKKQRELIEISDIRNKIAHGNPLDVITKDDTTIPLSQIQKTIATIIHNEMRFAFDKGRASYPRFFLEKE